MRLTRPRYTIPSLMIEVFVLSLALAFIVDLRERIRGVGLAGGPGRLSDRQAFP